VDSENLSMTTLKRIGFFLVMMVISASMPAGSARSGESLDSARGDASGYTSVLGECGRDGRVHFLKAFDGLWPIPSYLALLDTSNEQQEYSDRAFPWRDVHPSSLVFHGPRDRLEARWPALFFGVARALPGKCGLNVRRHDTSVEFGQAVVVISGPREHVLLVGAIADAATAALECYARTVPRARPCN
jgi:hypothetical protein